jgi:rhamnose utilization protein RhaD (predicted bifunctional aldolase and dehydrogenase)/NAD(P)-dependent dehydrogenase (short-subunit alcohol dehydrogenase family)
MRSRFDAAELQTLRESDAMRGVPTLLVDRVYTSRLIGQDPALVLHGGGNTSVKGEVTTLLGDRVPCLWVKGSGSSLDKVGPKDFPALDLAYLRRLADVPHLSDEEMVNQLRTHLFDASAPNPSVEALLHAFLPQGFVDHSHADAVVRLTNQPDGASLVREAVGDDAIVLPYVMPGFPLARAVHEAFQRQPRATCIVLLWHGLFTFGDTAEESYERHVAVVTRFEEVASRALAARTLRTSLSTADTARAARLAPVLRGEVSRVAGQPLIAARRASDRIIAACARPGAADLIESGPLTPDHVLRTKPWMLFLRPPADGGSAESEDTATLARREIARYVTRYRAYFEAGRARVGAVKALDAAPRVVIDPSSGLYAFGKTAAEAEMAADIAEHTLSIQCDAADMSGFLPLGDADLFDMEHWSLEQAKLGKTKPRPLEGKVALLTGGAGAIGHGVAEVLLEAGASVFLVDRSAEALARAAASLRVPTSHAFVGDVTRAADVDAAFEAASLALGGVDVVFANAGVAKVASLEELDPAELERLLAVNTVGVLHTVKAAARVFRAQGKLGSSAEGAAAGHVLVNSSKNVLAPGKDFGAYSASKAAAHQLGKIAALELAPLGVRVNLLAIDAVFSHGDVPSGLWSEVGPSRAKSRGLSEPELHAFYRDRNLLKASVTARHVGNAVLFFATDQTPTTGATLPIDGGIPEAFPR